MQNNFYLPFMDSRMLELTFIMQGIIDKYSQYLKFPETKIAGVYGSFNNIIWNGGRPISTNEFSTFEEIKNCINLINKHNLIYKFTFTNQLLDESHCNDIYSNKILDLINETNNEIVIHSQILEDYIKDKYPSIQLTSSITKGFDLETFQKEIDKDYKAVVCYAKKNILQYIKDLQKEKQNKVEILLSGNACATCKLYKKHYESISYFNLYGKYQNHVCPLESGMSPQIIAEEDLVFNIDFLQKLNIHNYKIQGRTSSVNRLIEIYLNIFFQPQIIDEIRKDIYEMLGDKCENF